jgi:hypothetical protein
VITSDRTGSKKPGLKPVKSGEQLSGRESELGEEPILPCL